MALDDFSYFSQRISDWKATSYGDIGAFSGLGGGVKHLKLWSPSTKRSVNSLILQIGVGAEMEFKTEILTVINGKIQNFLKGKDGAVSELSYKALACKRQFSIVDYINSSCVGGEGSVALVKGKKTGVLSVINPQIGALFDIPAEFEVTWGIGGGISAFEGTVIGVGTQFYDYNMQQRFRREQARKPTDPVIMDLAK